MIREVWRQVKKVLIFIILSLLSWQSRMVFYGIDQGIGQLKIVTNTKPVEEVMADPEFPDSLKRKLQLIQEIRRFAIDSLGIRNSDNYQTVFDQQGKPLLWVVKACPPYELESHKWHYPILGDLGYMGFFKYNKAVVEQQRLKKKGYDTQIGEVSAWSTLGWFQDPILSEMLTRSEGSLARLIIHELTHATLYIKDNADYNENLATFVGDNGAILFLERKYGIDSEEYLGYLGQLADVRKYSAHILEGSKRLDSIYANFNTADTAIRNDLKRAMIDEIISDADTISFYNEHRYSRVRDKKFRPNNSFFTGYKMYREDQSQFDTEFREDFDSDFIAYLAHLKEKFGK